MTCGPHTSTRQKNIAARRNTHVVAVARHTAARRATTNAQHVISDSRAAYKALRAAETHKAKPRHTKLGAVASKAAMDARAKAHLTAHNTASKTARATARAHAQATARAHAREAAKAAAVRRAQETARQHFLQDRTCHLNSRDPGAVLSVPRGPYRPALPVSRNSMRPNTTFKGTNLRSSKPRKAVKSVKAQRAH